MNVSFYVLYLVLWSIQYSLGVRSAASFGGHHHRRRAAVLRDFGMAAEV